MKAMPSAGTILVRDWFDAREALATPPKDHDSWRVCRLERLHAVQISLDVLAYAHNIPLRLLRMQRLVHLDKTFVAFVERWRPQILELMTAGNPDESPRMPPRLEQPEALRLIREMGRPEHLHSLRDWVLHLAKDDLVDAERMQLPESLPDHYAEWFLALMPHLERDVWLTEMGNSLPVHNLARMVEHWALFVLMWAWSRAGRMAADLRSSDAVVPCVVVSRTLDLDHLELIVQLTDWRRSGVPGESSSPEDGEVVLLAGPYVRAEGSNSDDRGRWFHGPFLRFLERIARVPDVQGWDDVHEKAPGAVELADALEARAHLGGAEAMQRATQSLLALKALLVARFSTDLLRWPNGQPTRPLSRANWETMAAMACWKARWGDLLLGVAPLPDGVNLQLGLIKHRVHATILVRSGQSVNTSLQFYPGTPEGVVRDSGDVIKEAASVNPLVSIETLANLQARIRERQQASWSAYITAINRLLTRHSRRERPEGDDDPATLERSAPTCEEVDHLLRGFGARICRYLLGMARADLAELFWLDYSPGTPRLRHVGSAERLIDHRAKRQSLWTRFSVDTWQQGDDSRPGNPARGTSLDARSEYQIYRAACTGQVEPRLAQRKASAAQWQSDPYATTRYYEDTVPLRDCMSVPLVFNNRVVGVMALAGIASSRHFDTRMRPWLHVLAQDLGQTMYFHSQVWQMRQLNWLASNVPLEEWRIARFAQPSHPLTRVARCLANIFLCPGVLIWLKDPNNNKRFELAGCTVPELYVDADGSGHDHAPCVVLSGKSQADEVPLHRPVFAFALDQWPNPRDREDVRAADRTRGHFVQARLDGRLSRTQGYGLAAAQSGDLVLGEDFLGAGGDGAAGLSDSEALPQMRQILFDERGWVDSMAFALVSNMRGPMEAIGAVSLHGAALEGPDNLTNGSASGDALPLRRASWPPGWRPVVAHVQTYVPYVLAQTETIARPEIQLAHYLLHQARSELNAVSSNADGVRTALQQLLEQDEPRGIVRPWLRQRLKPAGAFNDPDLGRQLYQLEQLLQKIEAGLQEQSSVDHVESLTVLGRLIDHRRGISALGHDLDTAGDVHRVQWIDLRGAITSVMEPYRSDFRSVRITPEIQIQGRWLLLTQSRLWGWLLFDLIHNMAKYASDRILVQFPVESDPERHTHLTLRLLNEAVYDPAIDDGELLLQFGYRGSAGRTREERKLVRDRLSRLGTGVGLWGVDQLARVLGMTLSLKPKPLKDQPTRAVYPFDLRIPVEHLRRSRGH